ncbi:MAG: DEAD/DEAH box helicase [Proteobacteria bacterium]|nr:DEAD/DEAH box helicase [Pseudomonadota bacterium]
MTTFQDLGLNPKILSALDAKGYTTPTPIQLQAIPHLLEGKDILGIAQTGTGKTAAFSLPIIHNLVKSNSPVKSGCVRTLILTPTRELASQIAENVELYGKDLNLRHAVIFGGVSERPQITNLQRGVDILIATPGRLLDLASQGHIRFMNLEIFVLDEADRMLDMGFINDIKKIIAKLPAKKQTLFFSATMPSVISGLADSILKDPIKIEVTPQSTTVERIKQRINYVEKSNKLALLKRIVKDEGATSVLVFCRTKHGSDRVEEFLERGGVKVAAIHGNKSQGAREKALGSFRDGTVQVLIATDIAARGIDIPAISHVINYDIPMDPESYVHRIGRTARAGRQGIAISFCDPTEVKLLQAVEKVINYKIPVDQTHPFHNVDAAPTARDSRRDDRDFDSSRGKRTFGYSVSKERRSSSSSRPSRDRDDRRDSSSERRAPRERDDSFGNTDRPRSSDRKHKSGGLLDFIGLGKKRFEKSDQPRSRSPQSSRSGSGFGWFKKSDSRDSAPRGERSESRPDSFGNRERAAQRGDRERGGKNDRFRSSGFGSDSRRSSSDRPERSERPRSGGFGSRLSSGRPSSGRTSPGPRSGGNRTDGNRGNKF